MKIPIKSIKVKASDLRKKTKRKREPCYICGKHGLITELHHTLSLKECALLLNTHSELENINVSLIWLCPNHHKYIHILFDYPTPSLKVEEEIFSTHEKDEIKKLDEIHHMRKKQYQSIRS